jgi:hypothetical protein
MALQTRSLIQLLLTVSVLWLPIFSTGHASAADLSPELLRRQIIDAGMAPWSGQQVSLDETFLDPNRERVFLRQFVGRPILVYNYAQW